MRKNLIKISLDCVMAVILVLLYNSHVFALAFHEIAGLFIFCLFVIHVLLNRKWVTSITSKLFNKTLSPRVRIGYAVDLLLLISFVMIIISGILISQVLFPSLAMGKDSPWRNIHQFTAAVALILVGIHLGLHWGFISGMFKKMVKLPSKITKPVSIVLLVAILAFGLYSLETSSFTGWLTAPFLVSESRTEAQSGSNGAEEKIPEESSSPASSASGQSSETFSSEPQNAESSKAADNGKASDITEPASSASPSTESKAPASDVPQSSNPANPAPSAPQSSAPVNPASSAAGETGSGSKEDTAGTDDHTPKGDENKAADTSVPWNGGETVENIGYESTEVSVGGNNVNLTTLSATDQAENEKEDIPGSDTHTQKSGENKGGGNAEMENQQAGEDGKGTPDGDESIHPVGENKSSQGSVMTILQTIATYLSIIGVFAAATYYLDRLLSKRKRKDGGKQV